MKLTSWLHDLLSSRRPHSRRNARRAGRNRLHSAGIEALESRLLLAANIPSVTDIVAFSTVGENLWNDNSVISKSFNYSIGDSFGFSLGGFTLGTGIKVKVAGEFHAGFDGFFNIGGATVNVDYLTDLTVTASGVGGADINNLAAGDHVLISTSDTQDSSGIAMSTEISGIGAGLDFNFALDADVGVKVKIAGQTILNTGFGFDFDETVQIIRANFNAESDLLELALFDQTNPELHDAGNFEISYLDGSLYVPELNTGDPTDSFDDSAWDGQSIENSQLPVDRSQGQTRIDFFRVGIDVLEFALGLTAVPTHFKLGDDNTGLEGDWISGRVEGYLGVAQEMTFTPTLMVDLNFQDEFGQPLETLVETSPGSGQFEELFSKRIAFGEQFEIIHLGKEGGELIIDTDYVLSGSFRNVTKLYLSPAVTIDVMDAELKTPHGNTNFIAYSITIPLGDPIPIANMFDRTFTLDGFAEVDGSDLSLTASTPTVFSIVAYANPTTIDEGDSVTATVTIFDPDEATDDSDVYDVTIKWRDGTNESFTLDNNFTSSHITYDDANDQFSVIHDYPDDKGLKNVLFTVVKSTPSSSNFGEEVSNTLQINSRNVAPEVAIDSFVIAASDGAATLTASYSDPGVLDTQLVTVSWAAGSSGRDRSMFALPAPGSLTAGDVFEWLDNGLVGSTAAQLTIDSVDAATGAVSFTVAGYTYPTSWPDLFQNFDGGLLTVQVRDDDGGAGDDFQTVVHGLSLSNVIIPASIPEGDELTITATFTPQPEYLFGGPLGYEHQVIVNWGDPNNTNVSTFELYPAFSLRVNDSFRSTTDFGNVDLIITQINEVSTDAGIITEFTFEVTRPYLDDGDASAGNGTPMDTSAISLEISEILVPPSPDVRRGEFHGTYDVINVAPTIILDPQVEPIGNGGVMVLSGQFSDPVALDTFELEVDWGDGSSDTFAFGTSEVSQQFNNLGHVYAADGNYTIQATVTDDDTGVGQASLAVVVDFNDPAGRPK